MTDSCALKPQIALVGNPNCGKTSLFNALTGSRQKVGNYPGVTVERKEGEIDTPSGRKIDLLDLPGTYSLRARSPDEVVTRDAVLGHLEGERPLDLIVCVADATNLRLSLRLVIELKQIGRPIILALNMADIADHRGIEINAEKLSEMLGMPVVKSVAVRSHGTEELMKTLDDVLSAPFTDHENIWSEPSRADLRNVHAEAAAIHEACVKAPANPDTWTARLDNILLHPVGGVLTLLAVLFLIFQAVFSWAAPMMDAIELGFAMLGGTLSDVLPDGLLKSLIVDGIISGVGSVLVFLPQIVILFFFINFLEDFGYMARAAFLMDRVIGGVGLPGRAFIPLLSSFACAVPGIMATRVIDSRYDRLATILVAPLMTCSARIPVYTLIISAFVPETEVAGLFNLQGLVMFGLYLSGILSAFAVAFVLRKIMWRTATEPFLMELPAYKMPNARNILMEVAQRAHIFLKRAGTIIFTLMVLVWFLSSVPFPPEGATEPAIHYSFAGQLGKMIEPLLAPVGFNWQIAIAIITGLAAREVLVAVLGTVYAVAAEGDAAGALAHTLAADWSLATGLALLAWYIFAPQCAATLGVIKRETNSWRWPIVAFIYMLVLAYAASFTVYQVTTYLQTSVF